MNDKKVQNSNEQNTQFIADVIKQVKEDFYQRQKARKPLERQWELNMNFLNGNQYCHINGRGEITADDSEYFWQRREVFNHIAPIIEARVAKFSRINPDIYVRPITDDDNDVSGASAAEKLVANAFMRADMNEKIRKVIVWAETCGTGFYKVVWNNRGGNEMGIYNEHVVHEGEVEIIPVSPFEIFPDSLYAEDIQDCASIIHARAMSVKDIKQKYGVDVQGEDIGVFSLSPSQRKAFTEVPKGALSDSAVVIEKYERCSKEFPCGRLITVAGDKLLYYGDLPYFNGQMKSRVFPFVKQACINVAGSFFGISVIERLIPVQRAFNAVKNRKHEFMNRLSLGILTVEDGSVDVDDLAGEGLAPGKVLVYRQGSKAPEMMAETALPPDFETEEEKLTSEFVIVSGVSDVSSSSYNAKLTSGTALELLIEQDNERLITTAENIRKAYLEIAKQTIRLYAQFMVGVRMIKLTDKDNKTRIYYLDKHAVKSDDVYLENENELMYSERQKRETIFKLYNSGLLTDDKGNLPPSTKEKVLSLLGYKDLDYRKGISRLQEDKAKKENEQMRKKAVTVEEIDDDKIHIDEHVRYVLSEYDELEASVKSNYFNHIKEHKARLQKTSMEDMANGTN